MFQCFVSTVSLSVYILTVIPRTGVLMATQGWLAETPEQKRKSSSPSWLSIIMARMYTVSTIMCLWANVCKLVSSAAVVCVLP